MLLRYVLTLLEDLFVDPAAKVGPTFTKKSLNDSETSAGPKGGCLTQVSFYMGYWPWMDIARFPFCVSMDRDGVEVFKHAKTERGYWPWFMAINSSLVFFHNLISPAPSCSNHSLLARSRF